MTKWHECLVANLALRAGGAVLLAAGWWLAVELHRIALGAPVRESSSAMMLLAAIVFLCGGAGSALLLVGPGLWDPVEVSERWRRLPAPDFEVPHFPENGL